MRNGAVTKLEGVTISDDPTGCGLHDFVVEMGSWKTIGETTKRAGRSQKKRKKSSLAGKRLGNETAEESGRGERRGNDPAAEQEREEMGGLTWTRRDRLLKGLGAEKKSVSGGECFVHFDRYAIARQMQRCLSGGVTQWGLLLERGGFTFSSLLLSLISRSLLEIQKRTGGWRQMRRLGRRQPRRTRIEEARRQTLSMVLSFFLSFSVRREQERLRRPVF